MKRVQNEKCKIEKQYSFCVLLRHFTKKVGAGTAACPYKNPKARLAECEAGFSIR
jgi:hypothetical protein